MFGLIPKVVWSKAIACDDRNRIELHHNCLLLERVDAPAAGSPDEPAPPRRILIETGTGDKLGEKMSRIFGLDGTTVESALIDTGTDPEQIDAVIVSHLHFDHAGGLTRRCRDGEEPDWIAPPGSASGECDRVRLTFPNARVIVQQREWTDANANDAVMTRTYYRDHLAPLELPLPDGSPRLILVDAQRPFPIGVIPHRDELPRLPFDLRRLEVLPGIFVFLAPGHTWGQQAIQFTDEHGQTVVFVPDVMPTRHHVGSAYSLSYDVEPYTSMVSRHWLLEEAVRGDWLLVLDHEPDEPFQRVRRTDRGWFELTPAQTCPGNA